MVLSIVIPIYNEQDTLEEIVDKVDALSLPKELSKELILIDDGSKDSTPEIIKKLERKYNSVKAYKNPNNLGKTQTVRNGILESTGELVIIQDADLEYEPSEIADLVEKMIDEELDVVYGNRFGKKNKVIYLLNYVGNRGLSFISNLFTYPRLKVSIPDMEVCYKLFRGKIIRELAENIESSSNFGFEPEITAKLSRYKKEDGSHLKFGIVPITYYPRSVAEGKKIKAAKDGTKALKEIIKYNLR